MRKFDVGGAVGPNIVLVRQREQALVPPDTFPGLNISHNACWLVLSVSGCWTYSPELDLAVA